MSDQQTPASQGSSGDRAAAGPAPAILAGRLDEYRQLWERAATRLVHEEYHAEDLVDDWFNWWGKVVRDTTAMAALAWRGNGESEEAVNGDGGDGSDDHCVGRDDGG